MPLNSAASHTTELKASVNVMESSVFPGLQPTECCGRHRTCIEMEPVTQAGQQNVTGFLLPESTAGAPLGRVGESAPNCNAWMHSARSDSCRKDVHTLYILEKESS